MLAHLTAGIIRDADKSSTAASSGSPAGEPSIRRVVIDFRRVAPGRDTEIQRSELSPELSEMYKIHLARFSGIDIERVTIYVSPFLHRRRKRRRSGVSRGGEEGRGGGDPSEAVEI